MNVKNLRGAPIYLASVVILTWLHHCKKTRNQYRANRTDQTDSNTWTFRYMNKTKHKTSPCIHHYNYTNINVMFLDANLVTNTWLHTTIYYSACCTSTRVNKFSCTCVTRKLKSWSSSSKVIKIRRRGWQWNIVCNKIGIIVVSIQILNIYFLLLAILFSLQHRLHVQ